jgi:hypothetical protein
MNTAAILRRILIDYLSSMKCSLHFIFKKVSLTTLQSCLNRGIHRMLHQPTARKPFRHFTIGQLMQIR